MTSKPPRLYNNEAFSISSKMKPAIDRFLNHLRDEQARAKNTISAYSIDVRQFEQVLSARAGGAVKPHDLNARMVTEYSKWLVEQGYLPSTVSRKMAAARAFLLYLSEEEGTVSRRIPDQLQPPSTPRRLPRTLTEDEVRRLLAAPARFESPRALRDAAALALLYSAGMRASEAVQVNLEDLDLKAGTLLRRGPEPVTLQLAESVGALGRYLSAGRPHLVRDTRERALYLNLRGKRLSRQGLWLVVKRWAAAVDLGSDLSPHSLRHSLIRHLLQHGKSKRDIQALLGLSSPNAIRVRLTSK